jgi:hypothetical protein
MPAAAPHPRTSSRAPRVGPPPTSRRDGRTASRERRARERHLRRRRRDLLEDSVAALALTVFALTVTAGLGVIALLEVPAAVVVFGSLGIGRARRRKRRLAARTGR